MESDKAAIVENSEEDIEEVEEEEEGSDKLSKEKLQAAVLQLHAAVLQLQAAVLQLQAAVLQNPRGMAALQACLDSMVGDPYGYIKVNFHCCLLISAYITSIVSCRAYLLLSKGASRHSRIYN
jgi:hypothetical protein